MIILLITIIFSLGFAYFATQNTSGINITLANYKIPDIPLYLIVLTSLLIGVTLAWIIHLLNSVSNFIILRRKENTIKELKKTIGELIKRVHQLELENGKAEEEKNGQKNDNNAL